MNGLSIGPSLLKLVGSHLTLPFFDNLLFFAENTYQCMFYARIPIWSDDHSELPQCHELWRTEVRFTFHSQFLLSFRCWLFWHIFESQSQLYLRREIFKLHSYRWNVHIAFLPDLLVCYVIHGGLFAIVNLPCLLCWKTVSLPFCRALAPCSL